MRVQKLYSKIASSRIKDNPRRLPVRNRSIGVSSVERAVPHLRVSIRVDARVQVDARAARGKLPSRSRAVNQSEAGCAREVVILKTLLRHEKMWINCRIVAAKIHTIEFPWHAARQQHLLDVIRNSQHRLAIDPADIEKIL